MTGEKEKITKQKENVEIMIQNKIVKIGNFYQYNNIQCDIILGNDISVRPEKFQFLEKEQNRNFRLQNCYFD